MTNRKKTAHVAGLIYFLLVLTGIFHIIYVPGELIEWKDASMTVSNIKSSEVLYKMGIVSGVLSYTLFVLLPLVLYKLLHSIQKDYAFLMVIFAILTVPIHFVAISYQLDVLDLLNDAIYSDLLSQNSINALVMAKLDGYYNIVEVSKVFWGLWLLPFGYLVYKSGFLPKFFGIFLMMGCFGYVIDFIGGTFFTGYYGTLFHDIIDKPSTIGELGICLWLLIFGDKKKISFSRKNEND